MRWPIVFGFLFLAAATASAGELRVCADPNNMPFTNARGQGFENKLVQLVAKQLGDKVEYTWWIQQAGYIRNTLTARTCDLWPGIAAGVEKAATTRPYYRSTYMFVTRADRKLDIRSFDDPRLKTLIIGVQMGDDDSNSPPTYSLTRRGIITNVRGYMLHGDRNRPDPTRTIIDAVETGKVDVAVVWGPMAGYFAAMEPKPLTLTPVRPRIDAGRLPMSFNIAMGVRPGDSTLKRKIDRVLESQQPEIDAILTEYHIPWSPPLLRTSESRGAVREVGFAHASGTSKR